jgi:hypothetical protein
MARFSSVVRANCIALPVMFASGIEAAAEIVETGTRGRFVSDAARIDAGNYY